MCDAPFDGSSTRKLLVDGSDNVYVLGLGTDPAGQVSTVRKFSPAGETLWAWFDAQGIGAPLNLKWSADGALLVSARGITGSINGYAKIGSDGMTVWSLPVLASLTAGDAAGDAAGNSYLVNGGVLRKVSPSGNTLWDRLHPIAGFRVEADAAGAAVVSGFPNAGSAGLSLTPPARITLVGVASTQGSCSGAPALNCALGTLAPGAQATVMATVLPRARGSLAASAGVNAAELGPERGNNGASVTTTVRRR